jgi:hypothetical protein
MRLVGPNVRSAVERDVHGLFNSICQITVAGRIQRPHAARQRISDVAYSFRSQPGSNSAGERSRQDPDSVLDVLAIARKEDMDHAIELRQ